MCLIVFSYKIHKTYKLILAANRDEFHNRSTSTATFWQEDSSILAGRDLKMMGTWFGITKKGKFAAITNYRDPSIVRDNGRSRGELASQFLQSTKSPSDYLNELKTKKNLYNGFNLLLGDKDSIFYFSNMKKEYEEVQPGIHGLSNHLLNTDWPKIKKGKDFLAECSDESDVDSNCLFNFLKDEALPLDNELPNTGVRLEKERMLSPLFIRNEVYGTRSSTVLCINYQDNVHFEEKSYDPKGNLFHHVSHSFKWV